MLVLSRKRSERILIGSDICITVVKLEGNQVRLGIDAPSDLPVMRAELLERFAQAEQGHGPLDTVPLRPRVRPKG
jgi:carbon storage regulator